MPGDSPSLKRTWRGDYDFDMNHDELFGSTNQNLELSEVQMEMLIVDRDGQENMNQKKEVSRIES